MICHLVSVAAAVFWRSWHVQSKVRSTRPEERKQCRGILVNSSKKTSTSTKKRKYSDGQKREKNQYHLHIITGVLIFIARAYIIFRYIFTHAQYAPPTCVFCCPSIHVTPFEIHVSCTGHDIVSLACSQ